MITFQSEFIFLQQRKDSLILLTISWYIPMLPQALRDKDFSLLRKSSY